MFNHQGIEKKWQLYWQTNKTFKTTENKPKKFYVLDMFPYPSGSGLHVGHPEGYTATDIVARYKRFCGYDVLHPIGWDAFGLPAEQYAIQTGNNPAEFTKANINNFRQQLKALGFSYDYDKEVDTTDPQYYKWTQWIFAQMYKNNLATIQEIDVNWCEQLGTVLANEEVILNAAGKMVSERGNFPVVKKPMKQWVLKITNYADQLLAGLEQLNWPESLVNLQKNWIGKEVKNGVVTYHLKDWIFARQRYWGEPFPIAFDEANNIYLIEKLVELPPMEQIKPSGTGESPLANNQEWLYFEHQGQRLRRETNTMPQWAGSSWYYLAYILKNPDGTYCPLNSPEAYKRFEKWLPVDLYIGGQEHAVLHLLYARFWHKVLYDLKIVPTSEPFYQLVNQGMILGPDNQKMSKSRGNVINPNEIITAYGADTLRVYEMFMGPLTETKAWSDHAIQGTRKWLERVWRIFQLYIKQEKVIDPNLTTDAMSSIYHQTVKEVTEAIENLKLNIGLAKMMVYINHLYKQPAIKKIQYLSGFLILLSPFAPHLAAELMEQLKQPPIENQQWPTFDASKIIIEKITIAIQVNGKLRATIELTEELSEAEIKALALKQPNVQKFLADKSIKKVIYIKNKNINFVV